MTTKIISLIDTVRYGNWLRRLVLYIYRLCGRIPKTYEWNERKRIFDPNQIRRARQVLNEQGWHGGLFSNKKEVRRPQAVDGRNSYRPPFHGGALTVTSRS